jgi:hypothetical protein
VYAKSGAEALGRAKEIFEGLVEQGEFDYYHTYEDEPDLLPPVRADSPEGKRTIEEGMNAYKYWVMTALKEIRQVLAKYSDEQIFNRTLDNKELFMFDYNCHLVGAYEGFPVSLYDDDGEGITTPEHLNDALSKWKCLYEDKGVPNPHKDDDIWVVEADVHL